MTGVVVVGAGILGASVTYHLARLGVPVTLLDRGLQPAGGVTASSFAWFGGASGDWPGGAEDLRPSVLADHRRLETEVPGAQTRWTGSLTWPPAPALTPAPAPAPASTSDPAGTAAEPADGLRLIAEAEIALLEPHLAAGRGPAVHSPGDGAVDPVGLTRALVAAARSHGARVLPGAGQVTLADGGRTVRSAHGALAASTVVLAAGTGTTALAGQAGIDVDVPSSPAFLVHAAAPAGLVRTIVSAPGFEVRELRPGRLLMTAPSAEGASRELAEHVLDGVRAWFPSREPLRLLGWEVGERPMPPSGPVIGRPVAERPVYVAVMHSAVTLAPTAGRLIAQELATGHEAPELRRCRPSA